MPTSHVNLERLIYTSRMAPSVDVEALLAQAVRNNTVRGLTGALTTLAGYFFQYLEGQPDQLDELLRRLERDSRHSDLKVLERRNIGRRMFANWRMVHLDWNASMEAIFHSFSPGASLSLDQVDPSTCAPMFRAWLGLLEGRTPTLDNMNVR